MEQKSPEPMTPFDLLVTTPQLQMIKLLLPYLPPAGQRMLAPFIKFRELSSTLSLFRSRTYGISAQDLQDDRSASPMDLFHDLRPYLKEEDAQMLDMILMLRDGMEMASMQASENADEDGGNSSLFSPADLLAGMLSPEQQDILKGVMNDERLDESSDDP